MSDPVLLAELAELVARHANAVRHDAATLARVTAACEWEGRAAGRFRADASPLLYRLCVVANELDTAAGLLGRHQR